MKNGKGTGKTCKLHRRRVGTGSFIKDVKNRKRKKGGKQERFSCNLHSYPGNVNIQRGWKIGKGKKKRLEKKERVDTKGFPRGMYFYVSGRRWSTRCAPRLRRRLAPGRLTAMCHDRRTNAGNLQFSFALIDHALASKAFTLAGQQDCVSTVGRGCIFLYQPPFFSTLFFHPSPCFIYFDGWPGIFKMVFSRGENSIRDYRIAVGSYRDCSRVNKGCVVSKGALSKRRDTLHGRRTEIRGLYISIASCDLIFQREKFKWKG